jgi:hypothetical protein
VHLGDGSSLDKPSKDGYSETYACAQGYTGQYIIVVRKIWGDVAGGKATVHIVTDYGTPNQRINEYQVSLDRDAVIVADVKEGHRREPIVEAQLAKVQSTKSFATNAVLAQADAPANDPNNDEPNNAVPNPNWAYQMQLYRYMNRSTQSSANPNFVPPFFRGGMVGYRPNITVIPSGTSTRDTAVISGDRRYVRVTSAPFFSDIIAVDTFNFINGSGTNNGAGGGAGGGGFGGGGGGGGLGGGFRAGGGFGGGGAF